METNSFCDQCGGLLPINQPKDFPAAIKNKSLFEFIRERLVPINAVIAFSVTIAAILDFFAPKAPYLAWLSYGLASIVLVAMLAEIITPSKVNIWLENSAQGVFSIFKRMWMGYRPVWHSPIWQVCTLVATIVLILGQVSQAKADSGGFIASKFSTVANLQSILFEVKNDLNAIKESLKNVKKETSENPRKELTNLGYSIDQAGLIKAFSQEDETAINLFIGLKIPIHPSNKYKLVYDTLSSKNKKIISFLNQLHLEINIENDALPRYYGEAYSQTCAASNFMQLLMKEKMILLLEVRQVMKNYCGSKINLNYIKSEALHYKNLIKKNDAHNNMNNAQVLDYKKK